MRRPGPGSLVFLSPDARLASPSSEPLPLQSRPPYVLIVDDEEMVGQVLHRMLELYGCGVRQARSGPEAVAMYDKDAIDLVLLDVRMPHVDGVQTLRALQTIDPEVACCFMTGDSGPYSEEDLLRSGARGILHKPFRKDELGQVLQQVLPSVPALAE